MRLTDGRFSFRGACPWTASLATGARGRRSRASSAAARGLGEDTPMGEGALFLAVPGRPRSFSGVQDLVGGLRVELLAGAQF